MLFPGGWLTFTLRETIFGLALFAVGSSTVIYLGFMQWSNDTIVATMADYGVTVSALTVARYVFFGVDRYAFHSHHYFNSLLCLPLTRFEGALPALLQGAVVGSFIEGVSCWGMDPIFHDPLSKGVEFGVR